MRKKLRGPIPRCDEHLVQENHGAPQADTTLPNRSVVELRSRGCATPQMLANVWKKSLAEMDEHFSFLES